MLISQIAFSHPDMEERFRKFATAKQEIGGWFIISTIPQFFPGRFHYGEVQRALKPEWQLYFINAVIIAPNENEQKGTAYRPWDWKKAREIVDASCKVYDGWPIQFHSHPSGNHRPSPGDLAAAGHYDQLNDGYPWAAFMIVTHSPLRIWPYDVKWGMMTTPDKDSDLYCGKFVSWRSRVMKRLLE